MKKALVSAIATIVLWSASTANAASFPTSFALDTASSAIDISLTVLIDTVVIPVKFTSGDWNTTIEQTGSAPPAVSMDSLDGSMNVVDVTVATKILFQPATLATKNLVLTFGAGGPFNNISGTNPGTLDLEGLPMGITGGTIDYDIKAVKLAGSLDFNTDPVNFTLPAGALATINETGGPTNYNVTLSIPLSIASTITTDLVDIPVTLIGVLNFSGVKSIPEPGSVALFAIGLLGVGLPAARRLRRRQT